MVGDRLARITEYLVVVRGGGLVSQKTSILTALLQDEKDASVMDCFQKHGWNGTEFVSMTDFPALDEVLCSIGNIPDLLQDEEEASVVECFQKHGWNGTEFVSMPVSVSNKVAEVRRTAVSSEERVSVPNKNNRLSAESFDPSLKEIRLECPLRTSWGCKAEMDPETHCFRYPLIIT